MTQAAIESSPTRRAAVVPYHGGRLGLVILEGGAAPFRVLVARAFDVGRLVELPPEAQSRRHEQTRVITPEDIAALGTTVISLLLEHGTSSLSVETSAAVGKLAERERTIGDAISVGAGELGIAVELGARVPADLAALRASLVPWPPPDDVPAVRAAAALALAQGAPSVAIKAKLPPPLAEEHKPPSRRPAPVRLPPSPTPPEELPAGTRRMEIDPGSGYVGVVIAVGDTAPLHLAYAATHAVDSKDWNAIDALAAELATLARAYGVESADVERARHLYLPPDEGAKGGASRGTRLLRSGEVGAACAARLSAIGVKVRRPSAAEWRSLLVGRTVKGEARTNAVGEAVRAGFPDWPATTDDAHLRDAGGMALSAVKPPPVPRPKRTRATAPARARPQGPDPLDVLLGLDAAPGATETPEPRRRKSAGHEARSREQAKRKAERIAGGCICKTRPRPDCPFHFPKPA